MDNNQFNPMGGAGSSSTKKLFEYIGLACSALGCLLVFIFSIITCSRGFAASFAEDFKLTMSKWIIGVIIAAVVAVAGAVLSILSIEKGKKLSKLVIISLILAGIAIVYAIIPNATICAYNCVLND